MANILKKKINQALVYLRATEAVSRPIAFLMALFVIFFFISAAFSVFLLGRWGYRQIVDVNQPASVTAPKETKANTATKEPENNSSKQEGGAEVTNPSSSTSTTPSASLPNTGVDFSFYVLLVATGLISHQLYIRSKNSLKKSV